MTDSENHAVLLEALEAGGYQPAAVSAAKIAASRGLGKRTTRDLVVGADPAAAGIADALMSSPEASEPPPPVAQPQTPEQELASAKEWLSNSLLAATGRGGDQ